MFRTSFIVVNCASVIFLGASSKLLLNELYFLLYQFHSQIRLDVSFCDIRQFPVDAILDRKFIMSVLFEACR